ncbi:Uncharacterised protein [Mycobacterium tuberculosis]|nr:Uncharacterised protein [Mycobacterium tuberculosis]
MPTSPCQTWRSGSSGRRTWEPSNGCTATVLAWAMRRVVSSSSRRRWFHVGSGALISRPVG